MCTFMTQLPKKSKSNGTDKRRNMCLSIRPCPDKDGQKTWYRLRLLAWTSPEKNDRDDAFIERFVHQIWKKSDKGYMMVEDEVTCPVTKHVHFDGNRYDACPMCKLAGQHFASWKESGWKDRESAKKNKEIGRKYQAIIPVYVVEDPNYTANNGKVKVLIFNDKNFYKEFRAKIEKASQTACVFNGKNAVDCCIHMSEVPEVRNEGQPNEYVYKAKVIDKITFTTKPYDIPSITKDLVTNSGFDEEYYTSSTMDELQRFYDTHFKISNDDIPDDDEIQVYDTNAKASTPVKTVTPPSLENEITTSNDDVSDIELDDLTSDSDDVPAPSETKPQTETTSSDDADLDDLDDLLKDI